MRGVAWIAVAVVAFLVTSAAPAAPKRMLPLQRDARIAVKRAQQSGWIDGTTAARSRAEIDRAAQLIRRLPSARANRISVALSQLAAMSGRLTLPRALALTGQLKANDDFFVRRGPPRDRTDIKDADGIVYRFFAGECFEFHPLAEFGELNARVSAKDVAGAERLGNALVARGVTTYGGKGWEYYFGFGGGRPPWLSGMAQAVATQAFTRAATLVPDAAPTFLRAAQGAYRVIPNRLVTNMAAGPWIRLYAFDATAVLNAQLQTIYSLKTYAAKAHDSRADALASRMQATAAAMLPRFDTGYWTYYSLPHTASTLHYQQYVVRLLNLLAAGDSRFADAAKRFAGYAKQPPAFKLQQGGLGELRFWLSKPATVTATSPAGPTKRIGLSDGWHSLAWAEPKRAGIYPVKVNAVDWAGNRSTFDAPPIVRVGAGSSSGTFARTSASATPANRPPLFVGAGLDDPTQAPRAQKLGLKLVRLTVDWPVGETTPELALVAALRQLAGSQVLIELRPPVLPTDVSTLTAFSQYASALAQQVPGLRYLVLAPAVTAATAVEYAATLDAIETSIHAVLPDVQIGPLVDGVSTKATLAALARSYSAADTNVLVFKPAPPGVTGWTADNVPQLVSAFESTFAPATAPPVLIDGLATPTTIPSNELGFYPPDQKPDPSAVSAKAQGTGYAATLTAAACSTAVTGIVLDRLTDNTLAPTPPTGIAYASGNLKPSAQLVTTAAGPAQRGTVICPGLASSSGASSLEFPTELDASASASVVLGCVRDCLYVITLDDALGRPLAARRGDLAGGGRPIRLELPKVKLPADAYRLDVRLVDRVNPGTIARLQSDALPVNRS